MERLCTVTRKLMHERFGKDTLIALATAENGIPSVRTVNSYYENGAFYVITYALSGKMRQIAANHTVAVCGEWFTAHGIGENLGHVLDEKNIAMTQKLRKVFSSWYGNGHVNEDDPNTCLLRIQLTDGVLFSNGTRYEIHFLDPETEIN